MTVLTGNGTAYALQRLAREQMKLRLLADIAHDLQVCELEGWDHTEYLTDLHTLIAHHNPCKENP